MSNLRDRGAPKMLLVASATMLWLGGCSGTGTRNDTDDTAGAATIPAAVSGVPAVDPVAAPTGVPPAPRPPLTPARDADQDFLRHMLDHHETVIAVAHEQMMAPAGHAAHGGRADPAAFDSRLDAEKLEMLALLSRLYGETYSPRAEVAATPFTTASPGTTTGAAAQGAHGAPQADLATQLQAGAKLTDRFLPQLTRPQVRDVARRIRASQLELAKMVPPTPAR